MPTRKAKQPLLNFHPLTADRWQDLVNLFGPRGACGGCWCMYWRLRRPQYEAGKAGGNRQTFQRIVAANKIPGLLAYAGERPVGWCAFGPREEYSTLARSRVLQPVDDEPVWSITCFFIARDYRRQGLVTQLLKQVIKQARKAGAGILEGYPVEPRKGKMADVFVYTGLASSFRKVGFTEVARRSETRPIMRFHLNQSKT